MIIKQSQEQELDFRLTEYGIPYKNLWYMLLYAWNEPPQLKHNVVNDIEDAPTLDTLLCLILTKLLQQRFRIGLGRDYVYHSNSIRGIRGRINFGESLKQNLFNKGQAFCDFQLYSINVPKNQIIRATLMRMIRTGNLGQDDTLKREIKQKLRVLARAMEGVDFIELNHDIFERQQFGRNDRDYRVMLSICKLFLYKQMPADSSGQMHIKD